MSRVIRRRAGLVIALALALPALLLAQRQTRLAFVKAVDGTGAPVAGLTPADFDIREGPDKRTITSASLSNGPMRIMLLLDTGTSVEPFLGQMRPALTALVDAIPEPHEIGIMSMGRQPRVLQQPTIDRAKLKNITSKMSIDGGGVAFLDGLREAEDRFQKKETVKFPVYVMFVTDANESSGVMQNDELNKIMADMALRGTIVHTMYVQKMGPTTATQVAQNLAIGTGGLNEEVTAIQTLPEKTKKIAERIMSDFEVVKTRYQVQYTSDAKYKGSVDLGMTKEGVKGSLIPRRAP